MNFHQTKKLPKAIRPEEFKELISNIPKKHFEYKLGFLLAYGSGMRVSEVARCSVEHFRDTSIFIPESKGGVERVVPIPKGWKEEFKEYLPLSKKHKTFESCIRMLQWFYKKYNKKANLNPEYSFHSLRHGFATRLLESGVPINHVQSLLGHSNISITSIYTKANPVDALKKYEELF